MKKIYNKLDYFITTAFQTLAFILPFIFFPKTSETFEFPKLIALYVFTILIFTLYLAKVVLNTSSKNKIFIRRTIYEYFLIIFLTIQTISFWYSLHPRTSLLGYYSRFHGGLLSLTSLSLLAFVYLNTQRAENTIKYIKISLFSGIIMALWGFMEHFGLSISCIILQNKFDAQCWAQNVAERPFATLGQPNWFAAFVVSLIPLIWLVYHKYNQRGLRLLLIVSLFIALSSVLFSKSRSGMLGLFFAYLIFYGGQIQLKNPYLILKSKINLAIIVTSLSALIIFSNSFFHKPIVVEEEMTNDLLITSSVSIRKLVWQGSIDVWQDYKLLGTGPETFAYSYYSKRPVSHNITSEWNFVYNKVHNEYLHFLTTTGVLGLLSYLGLIISALYIFIKNILQNNNYKLFHLALLSSYTSLLVTNFFGFSTVTTNYIFFILPAVSATLTTEDLNPNTKNKFPATKYILLIPLFLVALYLITLISRYWYADYIYAQGGIENTQKALKYFPEEENYHYQLASEYTQMALVGNDKKYASLASGYVKNIYKYNPYNVKLIKASANMLVQLIEVDKIYANEALFYLTHLSNIAPTDPSVDYLFALTYLQLDDLELAKFYAQSALIKKPNWQNPQKVLNLIY